MSAAIEMSDSQEFQITHDSRKHLVSSSGPGPSKRETRPTTVIGDEGETNGICAVVLYLISGLLIICTAPFSFFFLFRVVKQYEKAVIFRLGKVQTGAAGPGLFMYLPCTDRIKIVDMRTYSFDIPPQEILTKDSVTCRVDAVVFYKVSDAIMSVCNVDNVKHCTKLLAQVTLRNMLGTMTLTEILLEREKISKEMEESLDAATDSWGVKVERVELKDVSLPLNLQRAMAAEAEASREAKAKVIAAEGELNASKALKEAADVISEAPAALQLRYLQTLSTVAAEQNSTIIFPMPVSLIEAFCSK